MRRIALVLVLLALGVVVAQAAAAGTAAHRAPTAYPKVRCRWVAATHHRKRHRVCMTVKAKRKPVAAKPPVAPAPTTTAVAPDPAPATTTPTDAAPTASTPIDPASAPAPAPARLQVTAKEFSLALSRPALTAGPAVVELVNRGEDPHDLHLRPAAGGPDVLAVGQALPGEVADGSATLAAGTYTLYCSLPGHELAGMQATLTVG